jgi:hypothetical protein
MLCSSPVVVLQATLALGSRSGQAQATAAAQLCLVQRVQARPFQRQATLCLGQRSQLHMAMAAMRWRAEQLLLLEAAERE